MNENFGASVKNSQVESENKGEKYTTNFSHDGGVCKMFITIYKPTKRNRGKRTILIQAESTKQIFNVPFVDYTFPRLYKEVKRKTEVEEQSKHNLRNKRKISYIDTNEDEDELEDEGANEDISHCGECSFISTRRTNLKTHMRKHQLKMYKTCKICEYKAQSKPELSLHMDVMHEKKGCHMCEKVIVTQTKMNAHVKSCQKRDRKI